MAERIGKILRIDKLNIVVIDDPFVEENIAVMKIVDMNIEIMNPFVEEVERARVSGKEIAKQNKGEHGIYNDKEKYLYG